MHGFPPEGPNPTLEMTAPPHLLPPMMVPSAPAEPLPPPPPPPPAEDAHSAYDDQGGQDYSLTALDVATMDT